MSESTLTDREIAVARGVPVATFDGFEVGNAALAESHEHQVEFLAWIIHMAAAIGAIDAIRAVGHADSTGGSDDNRVLGEKRAKAVSTEVKEAATRLGLDWPDRISIITESAGEDEPIRSNKTADDRARNRRVEVFLVRDVRTVSEEPVLPPVNDGIDRALELLDRQDETGFRIPEEPVRRLRCMLGGLADGSKAQTEVVNYHALWAYADVITEGVDESLWKLLRTDIRDSVARLGDSASDRYILTSLESLDAQIAKTIAWLDAQHTDLDRAMSPGMVEVKDWIARQQRDEASVYHCYR
jgi:hypothetical protein